MNTTTNCTETETFNGGQFWTHREMLADLDNSMFFANRLEATIALHLACEANGIDMFAAQMTADQWVEMLLAHQKATKS
jgi:hypothetical protein